MDELKAAVDTDTAIVSLMWANNETGVIFPVEEAAAIAKSKGALFHTDAVQAVGKIPINMANSVIDMLSALRSQAARSQRDRCPVHRAVVPPSAPFWWVAIRRESRRAGTENAAAIIALGKACQLAGQYMETENSVVKAMRDRLQDALMAAIPHARINGGGAERLPNTTSIAFEFVEGEAILLLLSEFGICASSGSACTSGSLEPSHVLRAMGVPFTCAHGSIRFSLSRYTTDAEIDTVIRELPPIIAHLRQMSPFGREFLKGQA